MILSKNIGFNISGGVNEEGGGGTVGGVGRQVRRMIRSYRNLTRRSYSSNNKMPMWS